jgi:hypothetical protein
LAGSRSLPLRGTDNLTPRFFSSPDHPIKSHNKGEANELEKTRNPGSVGWNGNQHVCLRIPQ